MKRFVLVLTLFFSVALATTYQKLSLPQQVERAEIIVRVTIKNTAVEIRGTGAAARPWTAYGVEVKQFLRGESIGLPQRNNAPSVSILGGDKLKLEGAPQFKTGEDWVLMLYAKPYDSPVVGFRQGAYRIDGTQVLDVDGKPVALTVDGKKQEATAPVFLKAIEDLIGGQK
jgi:hypothetical protein